MDLDSSVDTPTTYTNGHHRSTSPVRHDDRFTKEKRTSKARSFKRTSPSGKGKVTISPAEDPFTFIGILPVFVYVAEACGVKYGAVGFC